MFLSPKLSQFFSCVPLNYKNLKFSMQFYPRKEGLKRTQLHGIRFEGRHGGFNNLRTIEEIGIV